MSFYASISELVSSLIFCYYSFVSSLSVLQIKEVIALGTKAVSTFETSVNLYQSPRRYNR
jgi:hypothetical protein